LHSAFKDAVVIFKTTHLNLISDALFGCVWLLITA